MKIDNTIEEFECIKCGKKVKVQIIGELEEKICGKCWCKKYKGEENEL